MKVNIIFPVEGPVNGVKMITKQIIDAFNDKGISYNLIDTSQAKDYNQFGKFSFTKILNFLKIISCVLKLNSKEIVYMNYTAHGFAHIRDFMLLRILLFKKSNITVHIHESTLENVKKKRIIKSLSRTKIILINKGQYQDLEPYYKNIRVIKNALKDYYSNSDLIIENAQNSTLKLLYFSNLSIPKGLPLLKKIVKEIHTKNLDVEVNIYGGVLDDLSKDILEEIQKYNNVNYNGVVIEEKKKMEILKNHDFLLFLSDENYEVYPLVYIESLMSGLPIITTKQVVSSEVIVNNGSHLLEDNIEKTVKEILEKNSIIELKQNARNRYLAEYNFDKFINQLISTIYES